MSRPFKFATLTSVYPCGAGIDGLPLECTGSFNVASRASRHHRIEDTIHVAGTRKIGGPAFSADRLPMAEAGTSAVKDGKKVFICLKGTA
jgi:hypothetical protein